MKKLSYTIFSFICTFLPASVIAATIQPNNTDTSVKIFLERIKGILVGITGGLAFVFVLIGGLKYMTSAGNQERVESAKKTLTYALFGFILFLLVDIVLALLTGTQFINLFKW